MKHRLRLISIALIAVLLFMILGNGTGCTGGGTTYTLIMASTAGGSVTPAVGTYNYSAATVVNLKATPDSGYRFVNWTGGGTDIGDAMAATTTITMNADHTVTAHFALGTLIEDVPDTSQPPTMTLITTTNPTNYCAPMAMVNILGYWDEVKGLANAENITAFLPNSLSTVAEYLAWFMDTNNNPPPDMDRANGPHLGTFDKDIAPGTLDFVRWDNAHNPPGITPTPWGLPASKLGYAWTVTQNCSPDYGSSLAFYKNEINAGRPLVVSFSYWNPVFGVNVTDPQTGETISAFGWGTPVNYSTDPPEAWEPTIGHAVTGVGYILNWDPDGAGPLPVTDYVIVHDNWAKTPENVAISWANWVCLFAVNPG